MIFILPISLENIFLQIRKYFKYCTITRKCVLWRM